MTGRTLAIVAVLAALVGSALPAGRVQAQQQQQQQQQQQDNAVLPSVTAVRVGGDGQKTRFIMDLSQKLDFAAFALGNPYRIVLDLPQVAFRLPDKAGEQGRGLVKAFRYGLIMQGGSRVVLDTTGPVKIEKAFTLEASADQPARLVVDLATTDRTSFMQALTLDSGPERRVTAKMPDVPKAPDDARPLIVLDPGHGGIDQGARAQSGELEKDIVLQFATTLRARLERSGKYRVAMTRTDDTFIPLSERVRFGRSHGAALFVSIHCDSLPRSEGQAEGATVYTLSENASDAEAARLAEAENKADAIAGVDLTAEPDDVANILFDLAQRETKTYSAQFARSVVGEMKATARLHKHPLKSAGFKVLTAPDVPSVLIELGYLSTKQDLKMLINGDWQAKTAAAIGQAVDQFFAPRLARGSARAN